MSCLRLRSISGLHSWFRRKWSPPSPLTGWRVSHATFTLKSVYMFRAHPCLSVHWWESLGGREGQLTVTVWNGEWQQGNGSLNFWLVLSFPHQLRSGSVPFDSNSRMAGRVREGGGGDVEGEEGGVELCEQFYWGHKSEPIWTFNYLHLQSRSQVFW